MGGGIWSEGEVMLFGGSAERIEDDSGLNSRDAAHRIDFENGRHVLREIEDDGGVATLSGEGGSSAAGQDRGMMFAAKSDGCDNVFSVAR